MAAGCTVTLVTALALVTHGDNAPTNASNGGHVIGVETTRTVLGGIPQHGTALGSPRAPVVLTEFADLQCRFCGRYARDLRPTLIDDYVRTGRVRLELRLRAFIGPDSRVAARAAYAAATRDRMWNFVDLFYRNQGRENSGYVTQQFLAQLATSAGIPARTVIDGSTDTALRTPIRQADEEARAAGQTSALFLTVGPRDGPRRALDGADFDLGVISGAIDRELEQGADA